MVFILLLVLSAGPCKAQKHIGSNSILLLAPNAVKEDMSETPKSGTETESEADGGEEQLQSDIWAELRNLRDMVVEQRVELRYLVARLAAAESLVHTLQKENAGKVQ